MENKELVYIVERVQKDIKEFDKLYTHIAKKVYYWCYVTIGNEADAKDVAQESMIKIHKYIMDLRNPETFTSWMYSLVHNCCINHMRKRKRNQEFNEAYDYAEKSENNKNLLLHKNELPKEAYEAKEKKEIIRAIINQLSSRQKEIITLYYLEELKVREVADTLGIKESTVRSQLSEARKVLEGKISQYQSENDVKLYSASLGISIVAMLTQFRDDICTEFECTYPKEIFQPPGMPTTSILSKLTTIINNYSNAVIISIVATVSIISVYIATSNHHPTNTPTDNLTDELVEAKMSEKVKENEYLDSFTYSLFPRRESLAIRINLKKNVESKDIRIFHKNKELEFNYSNEILQFDAMENGNYEIYVVQEKTTIKIQNIDEYAPYLESYSYHNGNLSLNFKDEMNTIDYSKTYVEARNEKLNVTKDKSLKLEGYKQVNVILYNKDGQFIKYALNLFD